MLDRGQSNGPLSVDYFKKIIFEKLRHSSKQECIPVGCVPSATVAICRGVPALGGCLFWGGCLLQGVPALGGACSRGCLVQGVSAPRGWWYPSMHSGRPPVNRMTDRCKNITFATLLRTVMIILHKFISQSVCTYFLD